MTPSMEKKLQIIVDRYEEVSSLLSESSIIENNNRFSELSKEYSELQHLVATYSNYKQIVCQREEALQFLSDNDRQIQELAREELTSCNKKIETVELDLKKLLLPVDPNDDKNIFLEIRAGTGGDEAAIFAGDLFRMYSHYAESKGWKLEVLSCRESEQGGYKEIISQVIGDCIYSRLKFESGVHRVQRVPKTESQGRIHTSACTVAILPEIDAVGTVNINKSDLRIDTFRASGKGGQHINKTDSAIRITHLPTGIAVECQKERSQNKNKTKAMSILQAKLNQRQESKQIQENADARRNLVGSGDRSERIRTYNFPQRRMTDHRINLTLYSLHTIMEGNLNDLIQALINEYKADQLVALAQETS